MWSSVVPSQWVRLWRTSSTNIMFTEYCWPEKLTRVSGPEQSSLRFYSISLSSVSRSADSATNTLVLSWHHMVGLSGMATTEDLTQCTQPHLRQNHTTTRFDIDCSQHKDQTSLCVGPNYYTVTQQVGNRKLIHPGKKKCPLSGRTRDSGFFHLSCLAGQSNLYQLALKARNWAT